MSQTLTRVGHAVRRLFGSNFLTNKVEEIGSTNNSVWTALKDDSGNPYTNTNQLPTTSYHADGTEGQLITGVKKIVGKDGIDSLTNTLQTIMHEHHEIHSGSHYFVANYVDIPINNVVDFQITTPDTTKQGHFIFKLDYENKTLWTIYEGVNIILAGTTITPRNNNRNSSNTSDIIFATIANSSIVNANLDTDISGALLLERAIVGARQTGGQDRRNNEIILKQNTSYSIRLFATVAGYVDYRFDWYEHTPKN